ncbi:MAG TPA: N-acyl homoserine lactonase family protein [Solirubrobacteraceae bacterium]|nr:N-acyl homoserine lactonase family protein [Solirubrobacteraceae bacterium]
MRIERFNVGWITSPAAVYRQGEPPEQELRFPIPAYLIETESERVLIDTGLHPDAIADPIAFYEHPAVGLFKLEQDRPIVEQIDPSTLTKIVVTHLHFDHVGALTLLPPGVPIYMQRRELEAGKDAEAIKRNFLYPRDYATALDEREPILLDGDHDLLGDGSIELLLTPGHTPGHQSVRVGEELILGVDVAHFQSTLDDRRFPSFADDFEAQGRSADRLCALRDAGARVLPGHDPDVLAPGAVDL